MTSPEEQFIQRSGELFDSGLYCAESVLVAGAEYLGMRSDTIPRIATGFCSGLARTCGPCGAVTGAVLVIGLAAGRNNPEDSILPCYSTVQTYLNQFREIFGSINCFDLIAVDVGTEEGRKAFQERNLTTRCREFVTRTAALLPALLDRRIG